MEGKSGEAEFDLALSRKLHTIQVVKHRGDVKVTTMKFTSFCPAEILKKLHYRETLNAAEGLVFENARKRLDVLCRATADAGMQLFIDAEESWIQDPIDSLADEMMARYNADRVVVFNTYQLYRTGRLEYLRNTIDKARTAGYRAGVKIVRGAYVEKENERAARLGYVSPIQRSKEETDRDFNAALLFCLEQLDALQLCIATHNEQSCQLAMDHMQQLGIAPGHPQVGFAQLYGMGDHLTYSLAAAGYRAFKLIPYGSVREVIPYLLRRASENSSVKGQTSRELNMLTAEMKRRGLLRG
jgi:proline dehydrogenase